MMEMTIIIGLAFLILIIFSLAKGGTSTNHPSSVKTDEWSLKLLKSLEWKRFEDVVAEYFWLRGYKAETSNLGKDGGVDVIVYGKESGQIVSVVQCKAWGNAKVGVKQVRELLGAVVAHKAKQGIFITTSEFTIDAMEFGKENEIVLISGIGFLKEINDLDISSTNKLLKKATQGKYWIPTCPQCGIKMVERTNSHNGDVFWGCSRFPTCKRILNVRNN